MDQLTAKTHCDAVCRTVDALTRKYKVVPIVGAGISIPCGVLSGRLLMDEMRLRLSQLADTKQFEEKFGDNLQTIKEQLRSDAAVLSFERVMGLYSDLYGPNDLYGWLSERIPARNTIRRTPPFFPTFAHEILAHFVGQGLITHLITTNFDEVLETALEEELGPSGYIAIASESEFARFAALRIDEWDGEIGEPRPMCYVLKPHGTISRQLSLRHTARQVEAFSQPKLTAMREVLEGSFLLFLGFSNYNEDFWLLLGKISKPFRDIVIVSPHADEMHSRFSLAGRGTEIYSYNGTCDDFCRAISAKLYQGNGRIKIHSRPVRHDIRSRFFDVFTPVGDDVSEAGLQHAISSKRNDLTDIWISQRLYELELLIYLFKTRGLFVDLSVINCRRIRHALDYCWSYTRGANTQKARPFEVLDQILNRNNERLIEQSLIADRLALQALAARWIFLLVPSDFGGPASDRMPRIAKIASDRFAEHILSELSFSETNQSSDLWRLRLKRFSRYLAPHLDQLSHEFDIDITGEDLSTLLSFSAPHRLTQYSELATRTGDLIASGEWNRLRVATVAGEWHAKQLRRVSGPARQTHCKIEIMTNLDMFTPKASGDSQAVSIAPARIYHYQHVTDSMADLLTALASWRDVALDWFGYRNLEHHLTLVSKQNTQKSRSDEEFLSAVYFRRPGKSTSISPVFLSNTQDLKSLAEYYDARTELARRASAETWKRGVGKIFRAVKKGNTLVITLTRESPDLFEALFNALKGKLASEIQNAKITIR